MLPLLLLVRRRHMNGHVSTLPIVASGSPSADVASSSIAPPLLSDARSAAADDHMKRSQVAPIEFLSSRRAETGAAACAHFRQTFPSTNPNLRRLEELYRDIAAQKEVTARLGSSLRAHADELDDSLSGRSQSLSSTPPFNFFPQEPSHSPSPSTSHSRDSPSNSSRRAVRRCRFPRPFRRRRCVRVRPDLPLFAECEWERERLYSRLASRLRRSCARAVHKCVGTQAVDRLALSARRAAATIRVAHSAPHADAAGRHSASSREPNCGTRMILILSTAKEKSIYRIIRSRLLI